MKINHNIQALNAYRNLSQTMGQTSKSLEKLSSGLRINRAADDAAGLAISEKMRSQIRGLGMAERNSLDAISLIQTAEGALSSTHEILQRMRELAVQASNGTLEDEDRQSIQEEVNQLTTEINRIGNSTEFNRKKLLNSQIAPNARAMEIDAEAGFNKGTTELEGTSLTLDPKSELVSGDYNVRVEDVYTKTVSASGTPAAGISSVGLTSTDTSLDTGTYGVKVQEEQVKAVVGDPASTSPIADEITVAPNSNLGDGPVTLEVKKENAVASFQSNGSGISNVEITSATPDLNETDSFKVDVVNKPSEVEVGTLTKTFISDIDVDTAKFGQAGNDFQLEYTETTPGQYSVTLKDSAGKALSDAVILDNNMQDYKFYNNGSEIGVSFKTVSNVNAALTAEGADGENNVFDIDKEITLSKNNIPVASGEIAEGTAAGDITLKSADGIDYKISHNGFTGLTGNSASFGIDSTFTFSTDGFTTRGTEFDPGDEITLNGGIFVKTSSDASQYGVPSNTLDMTLETRMGHTAELVDANGDTAAGSRKVTVENNGSYSFGEPTNISFDSGVLAAGTFEFTVGQVSTTNATLEAAGTPLETLENITSNSTLSFADGELSMNIGELTNGNATFSIKGGTVNQSIQFHIGANEGQTLEMGIEDMRSLSVGISSTVSGDSKNIVSKDGNTLTVQFASISGVENGNQAEYAIDLSTSENANAAIEAYDQAIAKVSEQRSKLGAIQNRLEHTITNLTTANENLTSAESRIRDADMAKEMTTFTKNNILNQAGQAMLSQANQLPQGILQLLK
ncbi:flagellin N-terminal helical domain-containing protein [Bacillus sp. SG-1]|uniref:flagellin N-terminal helical domain-containing protein n=1 Tax=Bacillus sp. SG-1 TaxID=161544 RepID=UPI0001544BF9|nr:flagellin [Bacillus sp. SG-1]EDL63916.1 flagellar protein [Bacillus sp. SG-1]